MAFQITDDILDVEGSKQTTGKDTALDELADKATYPKLMGLEESRRRAEELTAHAEEYLTIFSEKAEPLRQIACLIGRRIC